jgi:predicted aconitase with swiveling domain
VKVDRVLVAGSAEGELLVLEEPVSFWGGVDPTTGRIVDPRHPQVDLLLGGRIMAIPHARGSSGTSSALAELLRTGLGPAGIVLGAMDSMFTVGSLVAARLYGVACPIVLAALPDHSRGRWCIDGETLERSSGGNWRSSEVADA